MAIKTKVEDKSLEVDNVAKEFIPSGSSAGPPHLEQGATNAGDRS